MKELINKWVKMPNSAKSTIVFIVSSFILRGISFITTPIFTRLMEASQYGVISTFNSWSNIIEVFALLGLTSAGVFNVGLSDYSDRRNSYIFSLLCLCNLTTVLVFGILGGIYCFFKVELLLPANQLLLMFIWMILRPAQIFWITRQKYEFKYKLAFLITIISTLFAQAIPICLIKNASGNNLGEIKLWSQTLTLSLFALPIYIHIFIKGKGTKVFSYWKRVLVFALPLIPHYLAQHIMSSADRIMLAEMISLSAAGIYSVVNNIALISSIIWNPINASLIAHTFENIKSKNYKSINSIVTSLLLGYAVVCVMIALIAPDVMRFLAPPEYFKGVYAIPPIVCVAFLTALYNVYANIEFYNKKSASIAFATIISTIVNIILNFILIPKFSFTGAAYTTMASYVVLIFLHYMGYKKCKMGAIYNDRNIFIIAAMCCVSCTFCSFLYANNIVRYLLILCLMLIVIWKHKAVIDVIKRIKK